MRIESAEPSLQSFGVLFQAAAEKHLLGRLFDFSEIAARMRGLWIGRLFLNCQVAAGSGSFRDLVESFARMRTGRFAKMRIRGGANIIAFVGGAGGGETIDVRRQILKAGHLDDQTAGLRANATTC